MAVHRAPSAKERVRAFHAVVILITMLAWPIASSRMTIEPVPPSRLAAAPLAVKAQDVPVDGTRAFLPAAYRAAYVRDEPPAWRFMERTTFNGIAVNEQTGIAWSTTNDGVHGYNWVAWRLEQAAIVAPGWSGAIGAVAVDGAGNTWFAPLPSYSDADASARGGVVRLAPDGTQRRVSTADGLAHDAVYDIAAGEDGSMWFATFRGASRLDDDGTWTTYRFAPDELGCGYDCFDVVLSVAPDRHGGVWLGRTTGLSSTSIDGRREHHSVGHAVLALAVDSGGNAWHAIDQGHIAQRRIGQHERGVTARLPEHFVSEINDLAIDQQDRLWVATERGALRIGADGVWVEMGVASEFRATAIALDDVGRAWIGLQGQLVRLDDDAGGFGASFGPPIPGGAVRALAVGAYGLTLIAGGDASRTVDVVQRDRRGAWRVAATGLPLAGPRTAGIAIAADGETWFSTGQVLGLIDRRAEAPRTWTRDAFSDDEGVYIGPPAVAHGGEVWFGMPHAEAAAPGAVISLQPRGTWQRFTAADGLLAFDGAQVVVVDPPNGRVWAAAQGVTVRDPDGRWHADGVPMAVQNGYFDAGLVDAAGRLWLAGNEVAMRDRAGNWRVEVVDGMTTWAANVSLAHDRSGQVWLGSGYGLARRGPDGIWEPVAIPLGRTPTARREWNDVHDLATGPDDELWIATGRGIAVLHTDSPAIR